MMYWIKRIGIPVAVLGIFCAIFFSVLNWYKRNEPKKSTVLQEQITAVQKVHSQWNIPTTPEKLKQINEILSQHFHFIGDGKQCTAYVSHDGQYVLKFLLQRPITIKPRFSELPDIFPFTLVKSQKAIALDERKEDLFKALMISYTVAPDQTGVMYVHLNPTENLFKRPLIIDEKANPVYIDVGSTQFILQKRAMLVKPTLIDLMCEGKVAEAKNRLDQVLMLLFEAAKLGIVDADPSLIRNNNIGFLEDRAIYVDTGKLRLVQHKLTRKDFVNDLTRLKPFYKWLQAYYPELAEHFAMKETELVNAY